MENNKIEEVEVADSKIVEDEQNKKSKRLKEIQECVKRIAAKQEIQTSQIDKLMEMLYRKENQINSLIDQNNTLVSALTKMAATLEKTSRSYDITEHLVHEIMHLTHR